MRKLDAPELAGVRVLARAGGSYCPGSISGASAELLKSTLDSLVKKKRCMVAIFDDGPVYSLTAAGRAEAGEP